MPWVYIGTSPLKCAYVWTTPVKCIYVWTTKVRPAWPQVDFLLIGWGWAGGSTTCYRNWAWWWGAGWVIYCKWYTLTPGTYCVTIGAWWAACPWGNYRWTQWWNSEWNWFVAYWGGWGGAGHTANAIEQGGNGWSWWGSWPRYACAGGCGCPWQWNDGGASQCRRSWGWGWYSSAWCTWPGQYCGGDWWDWLETDITWKTEYFAWWWGWWWSTRWGTNSYWWWTWWTGGGTAWTTCGSGWGGSGSTITSWAWAWWVFIIRYACWTVNITWWNCKYLCNWYCIHCFTSNGTLTVS